MRPILASLAGTAVLAVALATPPASAAKRNYSTMSDPADACQLSIPTTDTKVRPKASGFRNEGTSSSAFVICGISDVEWNSLTSVGVWAVSLDEQVHDMTCTGVIGVPNNDGPGLTYSSKTMHASPYSWGSLRDIYWTPLDFGGQSGGSFPATNTFSMTCALPPQVAIVLIEAGRTFEIGG
jgi:hypothetical protein